MDKRRKVLIITYYWPPSGGAGVQRWLKLSKYLCESGADCTVITVNPDEASYPVVDSSHLKDIHPAIRVIHTSTREPFGLYKKLSGRKTISYAGFANEKTTFKKKIVRFIRGNFFIPDARIGWNKFVLKEVASLLEKETFDSVIISTPPHSTQLVGLELKKRYNLHWIADMRDPWTDIYYYKKLLHTRLARRKDTALEKQVLDHADQIIVVSDSIRQLFTKKTGHRDKIVVIPNGFDPEDFVYMKSNQQKKSEELLITYTGTLSDDYPIEGFIQSLRILNFPFRIRFVGEVSPIHRAELDEFNVEYTGYVDHDESVKYLLESDLLLLIIPNVANNEGILTGKLFEYLAAGKPILGFGPTAGDAAAIMEKCESGKMFIYADSENANLFIRSIQEKSSVTYTGNSEEIKRYSRKEQAFNILELIP